MSDVQRPFGEITLGGEVRRFRIGYAAMANLAELGDEAVQRAFMVIAGKGGGIAQECAGMRDILWAALSVKTPGLKVETVARWLDEYAATDGTMIAIWQALLAAWDMPKVKAEEPAAASDNAPEGTTDRPTSETTAH